MPVFADTANKQITPEFQFPYLVAENSPEIETQPNLCSCVSYAKFKVGVSQSEHWGDASEIKPNSNIPEIGGLILTYEGSGHVGVVISFTKDSVTFNDSNYIKCKETTRTLQRNSKLIKGYKFFKPTLLFSDLFLYGFKDKNF